MIWRFLGLFFAGLYLWYAAFTAGCNGGGGGGPATTTTTPTETTTTVAIPAEPSDYFHLERVGTLGPGLGLERCRDSTGMAQALCYDIEGLVWAGWRDPLFVAEHCPNLCVSTFLMGPTAIREFGEAGLAVVREGARWLERLPMVNRRCAQDERYCVRSEVRKTPYPGGEAPPFLLFRARLDDHLEQAAYLADSAQGDPIRKVCPYDSIRGWCECRGGG